MLTIARTILNLGPDGGNCPFTGACRGYSGPCFMLPIVFSAVPVVPDFPDGLKDYRCTATSSQSAALHATLLTVVLCSPFVIALLFS